MSRLLVLTRKTLLPGFQLAGVDVYGIENIETAEELMEKWLKVEEVGLLAIDEGLLEHLDPSLIKLLEQSEKLHYLIIPGGGPLGKDISSISLIIFTSFSLLTLSMFLKIALKS